jgi:uncharacterized cupredoxin-like copper-binding protein
MRRSLSLLFVAGLVLFITGCGSDSKSGSGAKKLEFTLTDEGCNPPQAATTPGSTSFHVKNDGADNITEFEILDSSNTIVAEKENLTPGLEATFTADLKEGSYTLACPGGTKNPNAKLTVSTSGQAASASAMDQDEQGGDCVPAAPASAPAGATTVVKAALSDFKIELDPTSAKAGTVELDGTNSGTHPHEIVVVKGVASSALPTDTNGKVDEDKLPADAVIGELEAFSPGKNCSASFALEPGSYTLFCNVFGAEEGAHFQKGMVTSFTVT